MWEVEPGPHPRPFFRAERTNLWAEARRAGIRSRGGSVGGTVGTSGARLTCGCGRPTPRSWKSLLGSRGPDRPDHFWRDAQAASPEAQGVCARLTRWLQPVWGHRLAASDFAHGDLNISNVLVEGSTITGVVDWDEFGLNSRAADLASILFDWRRVYLSDATGASKQGADELLGRIVSIAGEPGVRCAVSFAAVTRLATAHRHGQRDALEVWAMVADRILDSIGAE